MLFLNPSPTGLLTTPTMPTSELFTLLEQRDLASVLRCALTQMMQVSSAEGAALHFSSTTPIHLQAGHLTPEALQALRKWQRFLAKRPTPSPFRLNENVQYRLASGHTLLKMVLNSIQEHKFIGHQKYLNEFFESILTDEFDAISPMPGACPSPPNRPGHPTRTSRRRPPPPRTADWPPRFSSCPSARATILASERSVR